MANSYNNMGNAYYELGNISKSLDCYEKSYAIIKGLNDPHKLALSLVNLANTYQDLGQLEKAFELFDTANAISTANHFSRGIALTENNLGNLYKQKGQYDKAMDYYKQSIAVSGDFENPEEYTNALCNMAGTLRLLDQMETARDSALKAFSLAWKFSPYNVYDNALKLLYLTSMALKDYKSAGAYLDSLLDKDKQEVYMNFPVLSEREKGQFFQTLQPEFDLCYDYAYYSGKAEPQRVDDAYDLALMTKGLLLKSSTAMRQAILSSKDTALIRQYEEWIALKRRIARNYSDGKETKQLEEDANNLEKRLVLGSEEFLDMQRIKGLSWKEVQKKLAEGEAAVEFVRFNHFNYYYNDSLNKPLYCALIIDKNCDHPTMVELFEEDQLEKILGSFPGNNLSYIDQVYGTKDNIKSQLYNLIWKPMESVLEGKGKVLISPVGLLHKISFSALAKEQDVFLSDLYEIENKSSTGKTATTGQVNYGTDERITLFGGINYNSDSTSNEIWQYLDGSLTEAEKIEKILSRKYNNVHFFSSDSATEGEFKKIASESRILHIATHGFFFVDPEEVVEKTVDEEESRQDLVFRGSISGFGNESFVRSKNPLMRSGLVFAGANDVWSRQKDTYDNSSYFEDGVLTAQEVATIDMRKTELVVLSACETGLGDIKGSEGVYGLQRSFKMAGVEYIIMSLWQVPDKETAEFMTTFYTNLAKTNDIRDSFNLTQHAMRKKYDPYYWGAFILVE